MARQGALETTTGFVTAPGVAAFAAAAVNQGTLTVRDFKLGRAWMVDALRNGQALGAFRARSPKFHDAINGIRVQAPILTQRVLSGFVTQQMFAQDVVILEDTGSAVAGDIENVGYTTYYENPAGANGDYIGLDELETRMNNYNQGPTLLGLSFTIVGVLTGAYSAVTALNAGLSAAIMKANTDYALLGVSFSESAPGNVCNATIQGPGTGNYAVSIPLMSGDPHNGRDYFIELTRRYKRPMIPVFNAADAGGTFVSTLNNENANTITPTFIFAALG